MTTVGRPALAQPARGGGAIGQPSQDSPPEETERPTPRGQSARRLTRVPVYRQHPEADAIEQFVRDAWLGDQRSSVIRQALRDRWGIDVTVNAINQWGRKLTDHKRMPGCRIRQTCPCRRTGKRQRCAACMRGTRALRKARVASGERPATVRPSLEAFRWRKWYRAPHTI